MPKYPFVNVNPQSALGSGEILSGDGAVLYGSNVSSYSYTEDGVTKYYPSAMTMAAKIYAEKDTTGNAKQYYNTFNDDVIHSVTFNNVTTNYTLDDYMQHTKDDDGSRIPLNHFKRSDGTTSFSAPYFNKMIMDKSDTVCMNVFLENLSKEYADDVIILVCDNAPWHEGEQVMIPDNITILYIPPYTPEMNPIEQIWTEIRKCGFKNVLFQSLDTVVSKLCDVVNSLEASTVAHITSRKWMPFV